MSKHQTMIMFPINATALIMGRRLIHDDHNLSLYCPEEVHRRLAHTISADLAIEALGTTSVVKEVDTVDDLQISNFVIFPTLDLDPAELRIDFALMCSDLFRYASYSGGRNTKQAGLKVPHSRYEFGFSKKNDSKIYIGVPIGLPKLSVLNFY